MPAKRPRTSPKYTGLRPASEAASSAARGASRKSGTRPELLLRQALRSLGLRYRLGSARLPGRPDLVFATKRVVVFCDGDFWHGRNLEQRLQRLRAGHNAPYWVAKIRANAERDRRNNAELAAKGWTVLRFWESDITRDPEAIAKQVASALGTGGFTP